MAPFMLRAKTLALLASLAVAGTAVIASASNKYLVAPDPDVAMATPAYQHANFTNEEAFAELDRRKVPYEKSASVAGVRLPPNKQWTNRVTVTLDDERVTGEWSREISRSATFKDFPRGSSVQAAVTRNQLLLKHPDGSVVSAKIVRRVKPEKDEGERD